MAIGALHTALEYFRDGRSIWTHGRPRLPGFYWLRHYRDGWPQMVEIRLDYGEPGVPLVVQEQPLENRGVEYLNDARYEGCEWAGPVELPIGVYFV